MTVKSSGQNVQFQLSGGGIKCEALPCFRPVCDVAIQNGFIDQLAQRQNAAARVFKFCLVGRWQYLRTRVR